MARYKRDIAGMASVIKAQDDGCREVISRMEQEQKLLSEKNSFMGTLLKSQIVNNEEILKSARDGKVKRAFEMRKSAIKRAEKTVSR